MRFKLLATHYLPGDRLVESGVEVGDGTPYPLPEDYIPSSAMEGLDAEGKKLVRQLQEYRERGGGEIDKRAAKQKESSKVTQLEAEIGNLRDQLRGSAQPNDQTEKVIVANYTQRDGRLENELENRRDRVKGILGEGTREEVNDPDQRAPTTRTEPDGGITQPKVGGTRFPEPPKEGEEEAPKRPEPLKEQSPSSDPSFSVAPKGEGLLPKGKSK